MSDQNSNKYLRFTGLAFEMLAFIIIGLWIGGKLDAYFKTTNSIYTLVLVLLSIAGAMIYVIKKIPKD